MAAIDKIYGTTRQWDQFWTWVNYNGPARRKRLRKWFYPRDGYTNNNDRPITNFPVYIDKWLLKNCPLQFVVDRIKEQYNV